ncbi:IclR family transcriptional regulator [Terrarubrum flagellatum]|uniref:IclR family transcriptional regulator n=1 Tax=Terrirubrum flagellatum TaxID=2895980 RepID=UPI0031454C37
MSSRLRSIAIVELLAQYPTGLAAQAISARLSIPLAATERLLQELVQSDYVKLTADDQSYALRLKLAAIGLAFLGASGITDLVQPILDDLAKRSGELVRLAIREGHRLRWVAKAQGSHTGLMYNPDVSAPVNLTTTANGQAWLACLTEREILDLLDRQPDALAHDQAARGKLMHELTIARERGFAFVSERYQTGMSAIAAPIRKKDGAAPMGTVSIAGPTIRMNDARVEEMASWLIGTAGELAAASAASPLFAGQ